MDKNDSISGTKKIKIFENLAFTSSYNFLADSVKLSPIRFNARTSFFKGLVNLSLSGNIDPYTYRLDSTVESSSGSKIIYQRRVSDLALLNKQGIGSLDFINIALGFRFSANYFKSDARETELDY